MDRRIDQILDSLLTSPMASRINSRTNNTSPPTSNSNSNNDGNISSNESAEISLASDESFYFTPPFRHRRSDLGIERINRMCDNIEQELRLAGLPDFRAGQTPIPNDQNLQPTQPENSAPGDVEVVDFVDLSDTQDETPLALRPVGIYHSNRDDAAEVVIVSTNLPPIIDLCTPASEETTRSRPIINRRQLSRRSLNLQPTTGTRRVRLAAVEPMPSNKNNSIDSVADHNITSDDNGKNDSKAQNPLVCPVCMDSCLQGRPTSTKCGHVFCEDCIKRAIRLTRKCPLCNAKISEKNIFRLYV